MIKQKLAIAILVVSMGLISCESTSLSHTQKANRIGTSLQSRVVRIPTSGSKSGQFTRAVRATSPRFIPPAPPNFNDPREDPRRAPIAAQPVILTGEQLLNQGGRAKSYSINLGQDKWVSLELWGKAHKGWYGQIRKGDEEFFRLVISGMRFDLRPKRRLITCQGMQIWMGFGPLLMGGSLYVHHLDIKKHLAPLAAGMPNLGKVAVIDAGHGRDNQGTRSIFNREYEKQYTLDWAKRLKPLLEKKGWRVYLTRNGDESMSLTERVRFADKVRASIFISLHFNAAAARVRGLETYCIAPVGMPSHFTRGNPDPVTSLLPNNPFDERSFQLAARVHNQILLKCGMPDRGVRRIRFMSVIKGQRRPAILVEGGYLSNPSEARQIDLSTYRQKLAEGIAAAL